MPANKFFPNKPVPPDKFVGREYELNTIFDQIINRGLISIHGSSGIGKTSLLNYIKSPQCWEERQLDFSEVFIVYHNCEGYIFTINNFWRRVLEELKNQTQDYEDLQIEIDRLLDDEIRISSIRQILKKIGEKNKFLLLLLDDYHAIIRRKEEYEKDFEKSKEMEEFLSGMRNLAVHSKESQYFSNVVTTFQKLHELGPTITRAGSPWYNHYSYLPLKPFSKKDINNYFFKSDSHFFISIPENIYEEEVLEMTGGYPGLLQFTGNVFSRFDSAALDTLNKKLTGYADQIFQEIVNTQLRDYADDFFQDIWKNIQEDEQKILKLIVIDISKGDVGGKHYSVDGIDKEFIRNRSVLDGLQEKGLIYKLVPGNKYDFSSSLMKDFVREKFEENEDNKVAKATDREILMNLLITKITRGKWEQVKENIQPVINFLQPLTKTFNGDVKEWEGE
ncbi:MAG: ATP-binding protein [Okeania sp.]|nr:ATP-binding protein [Okeania sp.]